MNVFEEFAMAYFFATYPGIVRDFKPTISLQQGLNELAEWAKTYEWGAVDLFENSLKELKEKHLA